MKKTPAAYYPLYLNIEGKTCLVIGGGMVALRKVQALLEFGARVLVISPRLCAGLKALLSQSKIKALHRAYQPGDLKGAAIAIAATASSKANAAVAAEGRHCGVFVNVVDDPVHCDFILPSYLRRGGITIAVSTSGMSPALARKIRLRIGQEFGPEYEALSVLAEEVRRQLKKDRIRVSSSRWQEALDLELLTALIRQGRVSEAKEALMRNLKAAPGELKSR